jgi:KaiC/GvpD/RAD55 family RecA-like ATPase
MTSCLEENHIINYLFTIPKIQNQVLEELKRYPFKNKINKEIVSELIGFKNSFKKVLDKENFFFLTKEHEHIKEFNDVINEKFPAIEIDLYLHLLTQQIKEFKLKQLKEKMEKSSSLEDMEHISKKIREIETFNLSFDSELVDFKDVGKVKELMKIKKKNGFLTGYPEIDKYVKVHGGFTKGSFTTIIAPPHTGKCVSGNTKVIIEHNGLAEEIVIKELFNEKHSNKKETIEDDEKFTAFSKLNDIKIWTHVGFKPATLILETIEYIAYKITLDDGNTLICADNHLVATLQGLRFAKELIVGESTVLTKNLFSMVIGLEILPQTEKMYDIQLEKEIKTFKISEKYAHYKKGDFLCHSNNKYDFFEVEDVLEDKILINTNSHLYYTNNILSHNTLFLTAIASKGVKKLKNVLYLSFEMPEEDIIKRVYCNIFGKEMQEVDEHYDDIQSIFTGMGDSEIGNLKVKEYPSSTCTPTMIENLLEKLLEKYKIDKTNFFPDIVIVDQLTTMGSDLKSGSGLYERGKDAIEKLKAIGQKFKVIMFSAAQANRESTKSKEGIQMDNVAESWGIPQISDVCFGAISNKLSTKGDYYELDINCFKNRLGGNMESSVWAVNKQKMNFVEREI